MQRSSDGRFYPNLPGAKTKGIPVKMKVPTHVEVRIDEAFFLQTQDDGEKKKLSEARILRHDGQPLRALTVNTKLVYTDKVFTVDFRRPAGGLLNLSGVTMDSEQYFVSIQAAYEERTLEQITTALGTLKTGTAGSLAASTASKSEGTVNAVEVGKDAQGSIGAGARTIALARFDISEPGWEERLQCFVEQHVTACYQGCDVKN
jgi:hypothetical protein